MNGKDYRLSRIFSEIDGHSAILPIDHGVVMGNVEGLENPIQVLGDLYSENIDSVLVNEGVNIQAGSILGKRKSPSRILNASTFYEDGNAFYHGQIFSPEFAVRKGYDAIKVLLLWDLPIKDRLENVQMIASLIEKSNQWEIPVVVEPTTLRPIEDRKNRISVLSDATRVAFELGADILKVAHPADPEVLSKWCQQFSVPIVLLGGSKNDSIEEIVRKVEEAMKLGVKGIAMGRNVWQRPIDEAKFVFHRLLQVVHPHLS